MKPVARLGDLHVCPKHGRGEIVTASGKTFCDGRPVALVGDKISCGAVIVDGSDVAFCDGRPVARIGSRTDHGGQITTGSDLKTC